MSNTSNTGTRGNTQPQGPRPPKFIWIARPSFTTGECRAYFSKEDAVKDFGRPLEEWDDRGYIMQINKAPKWDPFDVAWEIEKIEVRSLVREPMPVGSDK